MRAKKMGKGNVKPEGIGGGDIPVSKIVAFLREEKTPHPYREFAIVNAKSLAKITELDLTALEMRVLFNMIAEMPIGNVALIDQGETAKKLSVTRESVNRALGKLVKLEILSKTNEKGTVWWKINPEFAWKGKTAALAQEINAAHEKRARDRRNALRAITGGRENV